MSNYQAGKDYEGFVEIVYRAILEAERRQGKIAPVKIERNKTITSKSGTPAEIDIYWEYEVAGIVHSVAIECKNHNKNIDIPEVRDFAMKIQNCGGLKGLMVTKIGFSKNAIAEASAHNIDLLILREQQPEDWEDRIKRIDVKIHILSACRTLNLMPKFNKPWAIANGFKEGEPISFQTQNDLLVIEDHASGFRHTLQELEQNNFFEDTQPGTHTWSKVCQDGWIHFGDTKLKLDSIQIEYLQPEIERQEINIDFEQYVLAVMEYINGHNGKFVILTSGEKKEFYA